MSGCHPRSAATRDLKTNRTYRVKVTGLSAFCRSKARWRTDVLDLLPALDPIKDVCTHRPRTFASMSWSQSNENVADPTPMAEKVYGEQNRCFNFEGNRKDKRERVKPIFYMSLRLSLSLLFSLLSPHRLSSIWVWSHRMRWYLLYIPSISSHLCALHSATGNCQHGACFNCRRGRWVIFFLLSSISQSVDCIFDYFLLSLSVYQLVMEY